MRFFIAIPTYNGGELWEKTASNIKKFAPNETFVQVIDSGSKDNTVDIAIKAGFNVINIDSGDFNHGGTRNQAVNEHIDEYDIVVFLTQDAVPQKGFVEEIIAAFSEPEVACAYGRQLPHADATPIAQHARLFNYSNIGHVNSYLEVEKLGIKTVFMSNSFSAYRIAIFKKLGGFPSNTILCEDMFFTAKALLAGYKSIYVSTAIVHHSHNYSPLEEFKRYFDIGVFHSDEPWIRDNFGGAGGEGKKFIISELNYLLNKKAIKWIPIAFINNFMKVIGYKVGQKYNFIPLAFTKKLTMHKRFWGSKSSKML